MKYVITALKAPWPDGAKVGDVIDMPNLPEWAVGKCRVDTDDLKPTVKWKAPKPAVVVEENIPPDDRIPAAINDLNAQLASVTAERDSLKADVASGSSALEEALAENHSLQGQIDDLKAATQTDDGKAAAALKAAEDQAQAEKAKADAKG